MYNSSLYATIEDAIDAFNIKHGTNIQNVEPGSQNAVQIPFSVAELNNFAITATALDPAILLTWNANLNAVLVNYLKVMI